MRRAKMDLREVLSAVGSPGGLDSGAKGLNGEFTLKHAVELYVTLGQADKTPLQQALLALLARVVEMKIISDEKIVAMSRYWHAICHQATDLIRKRVEELVGIAPPEEL